MFTTSASEEGINGFVFDKTQFEVTDWRFKFGEVRG